MKIADYAVAAGDVREYELAVDVAAVLVGDRGPVAVECHYRALPRQNDTVDRGAVDTDDRLLADAAQVHVHTKFYAVADEAAIGDGALDPADASDVGEYLGDDHTRWEPTDHAILTDGATFEAAARAHFEETASATYERGVDAR